ncbi:MAG TPA: hypothetical protein VHP36_04390 [Chitinispirillaceae bacterium]|nr:hypothetical protein [Chitinispirillaceae bacterium]
MKSSIIIFFSLILSLNSFSADYFGRNKVQYDNFDFKILKTPSFNIHFYPSEKAAAKDAATMLERWYNRYKLIFQRPLPDKQPVILYENHAHFEQTNVIGEQLTQEIGGVTEGFMNRIVIPLTGIYSENNHVLGHELVHAFHYDIMRSSNAGITGGEQVPLWFIEGMSEYLSIGTYAPLTSMWMRDAVLFENVPSIEILGKNPTYFPYRYGHALWAFIAGNYGDEIINPFFESVLQNGWYQGFGFTLGKAVDSISADWLSTINKYYKDAVIKKKKPSETGTRIIDNASINLSPALSPDGKYIAYFSSKDLFSIDLFIADANSGKVINKLVSTQTDQHFEALRFVNSSGRWSPDGQKIALPVFKNGDNAIAIFNVKKGRIEKTIQFKELGDLLQIDWSPDSKSFLIAATQEAFCDLFIYDIINENLQRLTNDHYAELMPSWAPDGRSFLYITDKPEQTGPDSHYNAAPRIALFNLNDNTIKTIYVAQWAKHINPQFSPDGKFVYFISDPDGYSNIYCYSLQSSSFFKVTDIATGICGLTELAPALSVASQNGKLAFSVFEKSNYRINILQPPTLTQEYIPSSQDVYYKNIKLPPSVHKNPIVDTYLEHPAEGMISDSSFTVLKYNPKLRLLYVGNLFVGAAADPIGIGFAGGVSFLFTDLLGNHVLGLGAQINGGFRDFGGEAFYLNQKQRPNWGFVMSRIPYMATTAEVRNDTATVNGEVREVQKVVLTDQRMYDNEIYSILQFPFSINRRLEFTAGFGRISYDYQSEEVSVIGNSIIDRHNLVEDEPNSLNMFQASLGYVGDFSFFGFTGPVSGRRYRLEYQQSLGSLQFGTILADYRQYFLFNPLTLAFRFLHYGRYLRDSQDERLSEFFVGNETWIRGYNYYSFNLAECSEEGDEESCPEFNRLLGSRIGVINIEARLPILGTQQFGIFNFPYLPTDLVAFLDGGVAWTKNSRPVPELNAKTKRRVPVFSAGAATRFNLFGILVLQIYAAYPFQRNDTGWSWGFFLAPGW